ncbi:pyridoxamine 5'-phosphate oxidase family protein [Mycobacterium sp. 852002-51961_SCH5331710]|uniref:pyridoxamine 5'-phosphate oxidase family protein n=1 Tax=Mycobacterium sp. 852002-51961_SCH5331710 TaxID=1834105 RepID=UPI000800B479|nr:pyridoxamine 5'-phosphate oxidase family protein [Mycobacterium sp. 852002-51961_SCH5331710]OBB36100.1 pyridoxamine 5'-phosphate oxidase [Mycobacterium sp. 852002-51961_SCH5331710]
MSAVSQSGFHEGELAVQARAGVMAQAARLGRGMLAAPDLNGSIGTFLSVREFAVVTARGDDGRLWTSPLHARAGFLEAHDRTLRIAIRPDPGDPLHGLDAGQPIGMLAIDFATRRRVRVNGTVSDGTADGLTVDVDQAFGNCPRYIQPRDLSPAQPSAPPHGFTRSDTLQPAQAALITRADTFFLGTERPARGVDASHRGGPPGFVRVDGNRLWWPDYPGNNMFNSLGNIAVDPAAAVLFIDFTTGATVAVSGTAAVVWPDEDGTDRGVTFTAEAVVSGTLR